MNSRRGLLRISRREFVAASAAGLAFESLTADAWPTHWTVREQKVSSSGSAPLRVIIDTDPGVDDALALLLAMRSPELKIEAITAVAGNVPLELTLPNALRMVEIAGRTDIPVAAGASSPLMRRLVTAADAHGENGLGGAVFPAPTTKPVDATAAEVIRQVVRNYPHEVTLITVGPLTNVATALLSDPGLAGLMRGLVMMGGSLSGGNITPAAEFNVYVDPEAARVVFHAGIPLTMVGLDVTRKTTLTAEHVRSLEAGTNPVSRAAAQIARKAIEHTRKQGYVVGPNMHDSLAVAGFLDAPLLELESYYVDVETSGELTAGETVGYSPSRGDARRRRSPREAVVTPSAAYPPFPIRGSAPSLARSSPSAILRETYAPNASVAVDVDVQRFFRMFIERLSG